MKVFARILVILLSLGIAILALLPTGREEPAPAKSEVASSTAPDTEESPQQNLIRDLLGGAALDSGKEAKKKISEIHQQRKDPFEVPE